MTKWYGFLVQFSQGTTPRRSFLVRRFSEEMVQEAIETGLIVEWGKTSDGEVMYAITAKGKDERDN